MTNEKYLKRCLEFSNIVRDIAFGEVIECSANTLTVRVCDDDLVHHDIVVAKTTLKLLSSIVNDYLTGL